METLLQGVLTEGAASLVTLDSWSDSQAAWEARQAALEPLDASEWGSDPISPYSATATA